MTKSKLIYGTPHNSADYRLNDWLEKNPGVVIRQFQFAVYPDHSNAICILYEEPEQTETTEEKEPFIDMNFYEGP